MIFFGSPLDSLVLTAHSAPYWQLGALFAEELLSESGL